jgi:hypothetical protein
MPPEYQTVFEIGFKSFPWADLLHPGIFVLLGFALYRFSKQGFRRVLGLVALAFGALLVLISFLTIIPVFLKERNAYVHGRSSVIEGPVANFHPKLVLGPANESFSIQGVNFTYNVFDTEGCFHNDPPIVRPGLTLRIHYNAGCIQRVDKLK